MNSIKIAICDDSEKDLKDLYEELELYGKNRKRDSCVRSRLNILQWDRVKKNSSLYMMRQMKGEHCFTIMEALSGARKILEGKEFYRCNNSYIVNLKFVEKIKSSYRNYDLVLVTGERIPLSQVNRDECMKRILTTLK